MASEVGYNYLVFLSLDGTEAGELRELECQGDGTVTLGKDVQTTVYKNSTHANYTRSGFMFETQFGEENPMGSAQALAFGAHDAETQWYCVIKSKTTGGQSFSGMFKIAISQISVPVDGDTTHTIKFAADGAVARGVVA